jgi:3-oxoacyl-[acyl-carrier-protein] synthase II
MSGASRQQGRRVVVTGVGTVSPVGNTAEVFWRSLIGGRSGIDRVRGFDTTDLRISIAAEVKGFDPLNFVDGRTARTMDRGTLMVLAAASEGIADSRLAAAGDGTDIGIVIGCDGLSESINRAACGLQQDGPIGVDAFSLVQSLPNITAALIARTFGFRGAQHAVAAACASGALSILQAAHLIQLGYVDAAIAGCTSTVDRLTIACYTAARVLSNRPDPEGASRPFDLQRDGFVLGEGSAALILEDLDRALRRGAPIYAELAGGWQNGSPGGFTVNSSEDCAVCIQRALDRAGVTPDEVDTVSAHATSTPLGDRQEAETLRRVFGDRKVPAFAAKSMLGHCYSAAGGLESVATVLAIRDQIVPPTINFEHPDPACDVDCVPNVARSFPIRVALKNSFGFGGVNCCLVFRAYEA